MSHDTYRDLMSGTPPPPLSPTLKRQAAALAREVTRLDMESLVGTEVGPFRVHSILGQGGQATVFLAEDGGQQVALKVPRADLADRLVREAQILFHLDHPHIVRVLKADVRGEVPYVATEYHPRGTLADRLRDGPLPIPEVVSLAEGVLVALEHAHEKGVVHRDLKPANILFDEAGKARVADFGIGTLSLLEGRAGPHTVLTVDASGFVGTPLYMAPEQASDEQVGARADLYALGKLLYEALTACPPRTIKPVSRVVQGTDSAWDDFVFRLVEERPGDRFPSASAAREALQALQRIPVEPRPPASRGGGPASRPGGVATLTAGGSSHGPRPGLERDWEDPAELQRMRFEMEQRDRSIRELIDGIAGGHGDFSKHFKSLQVRLGDQLREGLESVNVGEGEWDDLTLEALQQLIANRTENLQVETNPEVKQTTPGSLKDKLARLRDLEEGGSRDPNATPVGHAEFDVRKVIEASKRKVSLRDLENFGFRQTKVLRAGDINQLITKALNTILAKRPRGAISEREREALVQEALGELDRQMATQRQLVRDKQEIEAKSQQIEHAKQRLEAKVAELNLQILAEKRAFQDEKREFAARKREFEQDSKQTQSETRPESE